MTRQRGIERDIVEFFTFFTRRARRRVMQKINHGLFEELKELVPAQLHSMCAHVLTRSKAVQKTGTTAEMQVMNLADEFRQRQERERRPRTMEEAFALMNEMVGARS